MNNSKGFTLLEVLIAMAIFAVMAATMTTVTQRNAQYAQRIEEKSIAHWVGMNKMTALEAGPNWPALGKVDEQVEMGRREWTVSTQVTASSVPQFRLIEVKVSLKGEGFNGASRTLSRLKSLMTNRQLEE